MNDLKITLVQSNPVWESPRENREHLEGLLEVTDSGSRLIIFPEMFTTGFSMRAKDLAEKTQGRTLDWARKMARSLKADLCGSWIVRDEGAYYNRLYWVKADGRFQYYDKHHLFGLAGENEVYRQGNRNITVEVDGWKARPLICYDLRFPVWARNRGNEYDLLVYVANWPVSRIQHWKLLLQARAVENQCYVAGVNRVGQDANGYKYTGQSMVFDPLGKVICDMGEKDGLETVILSASVLDDYRAKFPFWKDGDAFSLG